MKSFNLILAFSLLSFYACSIWQNRDSQEDNIKIISIDKKVFKGKYLVKCLERSSGDTILTIFPLSKTDEVDRKELKVNKSYYFKLKRVTFFQEEGDEAGLFLNERDIFFEDLLVFPVKTRVYEVLNYRYYK